MEPLLDEIAEVGSHLLLPIVHGGLVGISLGGRQVSREVGDGALGQTIL